LHELRVREGGDVHLETDPGNATESGAVFEDFLRDVLRAADEERAVAADEGVKVRARHGGPAALFADFARGSEIQRVLEACFESDATGKPVKI
jgi:predicted dehydrogenase